MYPDLAEKNTTTTSVTMVLGVAPEKGHSEAGFELAAGSGHQKSACPGSTRCYNCWYSGHIARNCPTSRAARAQPATGSKEVATKPAGGEKPRKEVLEALPPRKKGREEGVAAGDGMASFQICAQQPSRVMKEWRTGDANIRPESGRCTISWTPRMVETEAIFEQKVLLATVLGNQPALSPRDLVAVIVDCGILPAHFRVELQMASFLGIRTSEEFTPADGDLRSWTRVGSRRRCSGDAVKPTTVARWVGNHLLEPRHWEPT
ncbi:hypothetical protein OsI_38776 [Oryza sativa Indica Group]|uniref:Metallothionein-like protein n=1 Tax=Oryza sativa subsp. indica TaxID=39946 RepID=B8BMK3_ORYSI|nr:hypothetical protein OsI_38776 [Oryza sativa Indica Group]